MAAAGPDSDFDNVKSSARELIAAVENVAAAPTKTNKGSRAGKTKTDAQVALQKSTKNLNEDLYKLRNSPRIHAKLRTADQLNLNAKDKSLLRAMWKSLIEVEAKGDQASEELCQSLHDATRAFVTTLNPLLLSKEEKEAQEQQQEQKRGEFVRRKGPVSSEQLRRRDRLAAKKTDMEKFREKARRDAEFLATLRTDEVDMDDDVYVSDYESDNDECEQEEAEGKDGDSHGYEEGDVEAKDGDRQQLW